MNDRSNEPERKRRRGLLAALLALLRGGGAGYYLALGVAGLGIALTAALALWYLQSRQPLVQALQNIPVVGDMPGVRAAQAGPPFLFAIYGLDAPLGVAVSADGQWLYATDRDGDRVVHVYDRAGVEVGRLAPPANADVAFEPLHLALAPDGGLYVSDLENGAVHEFAPDGSYRGALRPHGLASGGWFPVALAVDGQGNLYVTEFSPGQHQVLVVDSAGKVATAAGREGKGEGELSFPGGLAVAANGQVYVSDSNNGRLQLLDPKSGGLVVAKEFKGLSLPRGLAVAGDRLYLVDTVGQSVLAYALADGGETRFLYRLGEEGLADGQFRYPEAVAADRTGRVYVADRVNNRVQVFGNQ